MDRDRLLERLVAAFLPELQEHVRALNEDLLQLEKDPRSPRRAELLQRLFGVAHSIKGSSRAASIAPIEAASSRIEELLAALREGRRELPEVIDTLFELIDGIEDAGHRLRAGEGLERAPLLQSLDRLGGPSPTAPATRLRTAPAGEETQPPTGLETLRMPAERLDRLLALTGGLRATGHLGRDLEAELHQLRAHLDTWSAEQQGAEKLLRALSERAPGLPERPGQTSVAAAAAALARSRHRLDLLRVTTQRMNAMIAGSRRLIVETTAPLMDEMRALRMLPFAEACRGLERAVRDLAHQADKEIELTISGADVELDGAIAQSLRVPLLHMVRNAVDHGIEPPDERRAAGKSAKGRIRIRAALRGSEVNIEVADDGRGIDLQAVREQARRRGMPVPSEERELGRLILRSGFTTSPAVTGVSGRGVGLDVVRRSVETMQGSVDLTSEPGAGTRFVLHTPLTLIGLRVLLLTAGGESFALPLAQVRRLVAVGREELVDVEGRQALLTADAPLPVQSLAELLNLPRGAAEREGAGPRRRLIFVVVGKADRQLALGVEQVSSEEEVLVKKLGPRLRRVRHFSGAIVQPSGALALVLHVPDLIATALDRPAGPPPYAGRPAAARRQRHLLLVDDSLTTRTLVRTILEGAGYSVQAAVDGEEAWERLQREGAELIVSDVDMPRMDGFALTRAVRASQRFAQLPVVLVTALDTERDKQQGLEAGADAYLVKSGFDQHELLETIEQLLGEPQP